jgi:hypothetical protein
VNKFCVVIIMLSYKASMQILLIVLIKIVLPVIAVMFTMVILNSDWDNYSCASVSLLNPILSNQCINCNVNEFYKFELMITLKYIRVVFRGALCQQLCF